MKKDDWVERGIEDAERISEVRDRLREAAKDDIDISTLLTERGKSYGSFIGLAQIAGGIKDILRQAMARQGNHKYSADAREALDMIATKLARVVNGDPDKLDHWDDIAGYAKLVADRLRGIER